MNMKYHNFGFENYSQKAELQECQTGDVCTKIVRVQKEQDKRRIMYDCDSAFTITVTGMSNFEEFFLRMNSNAEFYKAEYLGKTAGYAAVYMNDRNSETAYITLICVKKEYQRRGVGSKLIKNCFDCSKAVGMKKIRLAVLNVDVEAQAFYKSHGFSEDGGILNSRQYMKRIL